VAAVAEPVEKRGGHSFSLEYLDPIAEGQVAGHEQAGALIAVREHLKQELRSSAAEREVAQLVADQEIRLVELRQKAIELVLFLRLFEPVHQGRRSAEPHPPSLPARSQAQRGRDVRFSSSWLAYQAQIEMLINPFSTGQFEHLLLGHGGHGCEVVGLEILVHRKRGLSDAGLDRVG
jgi:hypothetical protein